MSPEQNVGRLFLAAAEEHTGQILLHLPQSRLTYGQVGSLVVSFAHRMRELGVDQNSCVAIDTKYHSVASAAYLAIALLGGRWVQATRNALAEPRLRISHVFHDGTKPYPDQSGVTRIDPSWSKPPEGASASSTPFEGFANKSDIWMYGQSSGTTGEPKLIELSYETLVRRLSAISSPLGPERLVASSAGPPLAFPEVQLLIGIGQRGGTLVVGGDHSFRQSVGVNFAPGTPIQHVKRLAGAVPGEGRKIRQASVGGAKATTEFLSLMRQFYDRINIGYGATESGRICARTLDLEDDDIDDLGPPRKGAEVEIVDENDRQVEVGAEGLVRLRTEFMASGYAFDDKNDNSAFRDGWFYPGDLGRLSEARGLTVSGRINDQLSIGGVKISALLVDQVIQSAPQIVDGISFTEPGPEGVAQLSVVVSLEEGAEAAAVAESIRSLCRSAISSAVIPTRIYFANQVPRNERGKAMRHLAPEFTKDTRSC